jgi:protein-S-isoprenylcysteine O-methyltransferase Ste14
MQDSESKQENVVTPRAIFGFILYLFLNPAILFITAGTTRWGMAWAYFGISLLAAILSRAIVHRKNPGLLQERGSWKQVEDVKPWDKMVGPVVGLYAPLAGIVVAGLDHRFGWTGLVPTWAQVLALAVGVLGLLLASWAMIENRFFSAVVRIQKDRDHQVCKSGPYRFIRHPGYAGGILWYLVTPLILDSLWAFIPMAVSIAATALRTFLEDRTLQEELNGYQAYAEETPYRLIPLIW